jgi:hypothetical protein
VKHHSAVATVERTAAKVGWTRYDCCDELKKKKRIGFEPVSELWHRNTYLLGENTHLKMYTANEQPLAPKSVVAVNMWSLFIRTCML